jgi:hypothetical protein
MAGSSNSIQLDGEICDELWNEDEFSDDSNCETDMVVKFLSDSGQSDSSDDEDNVSDYTDMQHGTWTKEGAESDPVFNLVVHMV